MSGSGKTSLGNELLSHLDSHEEKWMIMDGDKFRAILGEDTGHSVEERRKNGERLVNLSLEFSRQGKNLIVCVLSIFPEHLKKNRSLIKDYKEIYIDVSIENLKKRDNKKIYEKALKGEIKNVVGVDIDFPVPKNPDLHIDNNKSLKNFSKLTGEIIKKLKLKNLNYKYINDDLLLNIEKYEYSNYLGKSFLTSYSSSRKNTLKYIQIKITNFLKSYRSKKPANHFLFKNEKRLDQYFINKELNSIESSLNNGTTSKFLLLSWIKFLSLENSKSLEIENDVLIFLKRFEVTKRIFQGYTKNSYKKIGNEILALDVYILFGILLCNLYNSSRLKDNKIIYFNSVLKICDIVASSIIRLSTPCELFLAEKLFIQEEIIYKGLSKNI